MKCYEILESLKQSGTDGKTERVTLLEIVFVGWRWLLVKWLRSTTIEPIESVIVELAVKPEILSQEPAADLTQQAQAELQKVLQAACEDAPSWQD